MTIVVDASVAVKWVLDESDSELAAAVRGQELAAPAFWLTEAANVLWKYARRGELAASEAEDGFARLAAAPLTVYPDREGLPHALKLSHRLSHPVYDCLYLALAIRLRTYVVTADKRFVGVTSRHEDLRTHVRLLGASDPA